MLKRCGAQHLVFHVGERQAGGDDDAVAGVYAHRVDVLHVADGDAVVVAVAHHLVLHFLPARDALLDEDLLVQALQQAGRGDVDELLAVVGDAAAGAAQGEAGADDHREVQQARDLHRRLETVGDEAGRHGHVDAFHRLLEQLAVLGELDRLEARAQQAHAVFLRDAFLPHARRQVQPRLAAERGQHAVRALGGDDRVEVRQVHRLDVDAVGGLAVGHDRRRVGVDQHDFHAFFAQAAAGLAAGVVELRGLADDDRAAADHQHFAHRFMHRKLHGPGGARPRPPGKHCCW